MMSQSVEICQWVEVPAKEVRLNTKDGTEIEVKPPSNFIGYKPIKTAAPILQVERITGEAPCKYDWTFNTYV